MWKKKGGRRVRPGKLSDSDAGLTAGDGGRRGWHREPQTGCTAGRTPGPTNWSSSAKIVCRGAHIGQAVVPLLCLGRAWPPLKCYSRSRRWNEAGGCQLTPPIVADSLAKADLQGCPVFSEKTDVGRLALLHGKVCMQSDEGCVLLVQGYTEQTGKLWHKPPRVEFHIYQK